MDFSLPSSPAIGAVIPERYESSCMSYHEDGKRLFVAYENTARLHVIDCLNGKDAHPALRCEREQLTCVEATHHDHCVLISGKGSPPQPASQRNAITYWSLYDNKVMRKFRGHTDLVTAMSMCPADDTFLSSSKDRTVRLWTAKSAGCLAELKLPDKTEGAPIARFDSTGLVFAVTASMTGGQGHYLHLYDARNYDGGAFAELKLSHDDLSRAIQTHVNVDPVQGAMLSSADWTTLRFNTSGNQILVGTEKGISIVMDGFEGTVQRIFSSSSQRPAVSCFSSDDRTLLLGNDDGRISCWSLELGTMVKQLDGHPGPVNCIASNPKYAQFASSCTNIALWVW